MVSKFRWRFQKLILPSFQIPFISFFVLTTLFFNGLIYFATHRFFQKFLSLGKDLDFKADHLYFQFIKMQQLEYYKIFWIIVIITNLLLIFGGILLSHKVAGPLVRFTNHLHAASELPKEEALAKVSFRKGDFFLHLAEKWNQFVDKRNP